MYQQGVGTKIQKFNVSGLRKTFLNNLIRDLSTANYYGNIKVQEKRKPKKFINGKEKEIIKCKTQCQSLKKKSNL